MNKIVYKKIIFIAIFLGVIVYAGVQSFYYKKAIEENLFETTATITGFKSCYRNGYCVKYKYSFNGKVYKDKVNSTLSFYSWCKGRGNCVGYRFKIALNRDKPIDNTTNWKELFEDKTFR